MKPLLFTEDKITHLLRPETDLEKTLLNDTIFCAGLLWGKPRFGHPEGWVVFHIREVLDNIERLNIDAKTRVRLRLITFVHDTFKYKEDRSSPRDWSKHHGVLARQFMEQYTDDEILLRVIELHDEAFYCWRMFNKQENQAATIRLQKLLDKIASSLQLYYLFFKCDTRTGDKTQAPLKWFETSIKGIELVDF